jgi:hypothetical protein
MVIIIIVKADKNHVWAPNGISFTPVGEKMQAFWEKKKER